MLRTLKMVSRRLYAYICEVRNAHADMAPTTFGDRVSVLVLGAMVTVLGGMVGFIADMVLVGPLGIVFEYPPALLWVMPAIGIALPAIETARLATCTDPDALRAARRHRALVAAANAGFIRATGERDTDPYAPVKNGVTIHRNVDASHRKLRRASAGLPRADRQLTRREGDRLVDEVDRLMVSAVSTGLVTTMRRPSMLCHRAVVAASDDVDTDIAQAAYADLLALVAHRHDQLNQLTELAATQSELRRIDPTAAATMSTRQVSTAHLFAALRELDSSEGAVENLAGVRAERADALSAARAELS